MNITVNCSCQLPCSFKLSSECKSPVAFDSLAAFLDVSKAATGVALLLMGVAVASHVSTLAAVVALRFSLLPGVLAVSGDVTAFATVVTGCRDESVPQHHFTQCFKCINSHNVKNTD